MRDLWVPIVAALVVGAPWCWAIFMIRWYRQHHAASRPDPTPPAPAFLRCKREACGREYRPNESIACIPEWYCCEQCEVLDLERMIA